MLVPRGIAASWHSRFDHVHHHSAVPLVKRYPYALFLSSLCFPIVLLKHCLSLGSVVVIPLQDYVTIGIKSLEKESGSRLGLFGATLQSRLEFPLYSSSSVRTSTLGCIWWLMTCDVASATMGYSAENGLICLPGMI